MQRKSFIFYRSFDEAIENLSKTNQLLLYRAITKYALYGEEPKISGVVSSMFALIRPQIDANNKKRENGMKGAEFGIRGAEYGKRGGRPRKETPQETGQKPPTKPPTEPGKNPPNVNVNVNEECIIGNDNIPPIYTPPDGGNVPANGPPTKSDPAKEIKSELKRRINALFHRRDSTAWSSKETQRLNEIAQRNDVLSECTEIERLYNSDYPYRRRDICTLLNNWTTELDRSSTYTPNTRQPQRLTVNDPDYWKTRATYPGDEDAGKEFTNGF